MELKNFAFHNFVNLPKTSSLESNETLRILGFTKFCVAEKNLL